MLQTAQLHAVSDDLVDVHRNLLIGRTSRRIGTIRLRDALWQDFTGLLEELLSQGRDALHVVVTNMVCVG